MSEEVQGPTMSKLYDESLERPHEFLIADVPTTQSSKVSTMKRQQKPMDFESSKDVYLASAKGQFIRNDFKRNSSFDARDHAFEYFKNNS